MKISTKIVLIILLSFSRSSAQVPPDHTIIVVLENKSFDQIIGNSDAPYINSLISNPHGALFTNSFGLTHPSQPNYLMLFSGSQQGVTTNGFPPVLPLITANLGAALIENGLSFTGFAEGLPAVGSNIGASGAYSRKHNPWVNWQGTGPNSIPETFNRPFSDFPSDFNLLPTLAFVIPDDDHDMHDGTIAEGDAWLEANLGDYVQWCNDNNSLFILTFDEDDGSSSNGIGTIFTGADIKPGSYSQRITHYNVLRTLEDIYSLPYAGESADSSAITGVWLSAAANTYTFTGNGNWNDSKNWKNQIAPPKETYNGSHIIIDPAPGGQCIVNIPYTVSPGTTLKVVTGKKIVVTGNLVLH